MNDRDIIIPMLRIVVPGDYDPALNYYPYSGPKGGKKIACPIGAFNPKDGYLTRLIRNKTTGIRHGYRGFYENVVVTDSNGEPKFDDEGYKIVEARFSLFSITLPDDPIVRMICRYPWKSAPNWRSEYAAAKLGNFLPMLEEIRALALREALK